MSSSNFSRGGAAVLRSRCGSVAIRSDRNGRASEAKSTVTLSRSVSPKPCADGQAVIELQRIEPIPKNGLSQDFHSAVGLANGFIHVFNTVDAMNKNDSLTDVQAATILRAQIARSLERDDRAKKYKNSNLFAPLAMKILSQLQTLGKQHQFTHAELQYFVLMCAPSPNVFEKFQSDFLAILAGMDANARTFCLLFWIAVMTMTNVPKTQDDLQAFYMLYSNTINRQDTSAISPQLAAILTTMKDKVNVAYEAIDDKPNDDPAARRQARQQLGLPPSEDDQDDDAASANSGFSKASASSTMSAGGTRRDPLWRFRAAIMCLKAVFEHLSLQSGKHAFFQSITSDQLDELVRGLMKKTTCRSSGPRSHNAFGRKIRETLLSLVNNHKVRFRLCIPKTTTSIILATGSVQAGLDWHMRASSVDLSQKQNHCICSALIMFDLGINGSLQDTANVTPILDAAFGSGKITLPSGRFAILAQSAAERASKDLTSALAGQWRSVREDCDVSSHSEAADAQRGRGDARRGRGGAQRGRGDARRGRGGANLGNRVGADEDEAEEEFSSELTAENLAALQARIRALENEKRAQKCH
jgi:hypothetical protein